MLHEPQDLYSIGTLSKLVIALKLITVNKLTSIKWVYLVNTSKSKSL